MKLDSLSDAALYVENILRRSGREILQARSLNKGRHGLIQTDFEIYYILFKRKKFMTYGRQFNGESGMGESINLDWLNNLIKSEKVDEILVVYPEGSIYYIDKLEWREYVQSKDTVRMTQSQGEVTTSIPMTLLKRWDIRANNRKVVEYIEPQVEDVVPKQSNTIWSRIKSWIFRILRKTPSEA